MDSPNKVSSLKVGALTFVAIVILIFVVLWIKGRSLSGGERIEVIFKDINSMRAGSAVQMMGFRIGQVEEIKPVISGKNSHVLLRFVITEKGAKIPEVSTISIQQSGIVGEQFLEITPPKVKTIYTETSSDTTRLNKDTVVYMDFNGSLKEIAKVVDAEVVQKFQAPAMIRDNIKTKNVLKVDYMINLPGLILDNDKLSAKFVGEDFVFYTIGTSESLEYPEITSPYTVIEPMRLSDFMDLQYKAAKALNETNDRVAKILSNDLVYEIQQSVKNVNQLTGQAITTLNKAEALIDSSRGDINSILKQSDGLISRLLLLSDNLNKIVGDTALHEDIKNATRSVTKLSNNINDILEDEDTEEMLANVEEITGNLADISHYINEFTEDENLKKDLTGVLGNLNRLTTSVNTTLADLHELDDGEKVKLQDTISDTLVITRNLKKFSEKLNKRFLLFRLMF